MRLLYLVLITVCLLFPSLVSAAPHNISVVVISDAEENSIRIMNTWGREFRDDLVMVTDSNNTRTTKHKQWVRGLTIAWKRACATIQWFIVLEDTVELFPSYILEENPAMMIVFVGGVLLSRALVHELMQSQFEQCMDYTDTGEAFVDVPVCIIQKGGLMMTGNKVTPY